MTVPACMAIFDFDHGATIPSCTARRWSKARKAGFKPYCGQVRGERRSRSSREQAEAPEQDFIASASKDHFKLKGDCASDRKCASLAA
jgi:hypothetical protein